MRALLIAVAVILWPILALGEITGCPSYKFRPAQNPGVWALQRLASLVAPKDVQLMTRRDDLELSHGATAEVRENAVKQDRVRITNAIGHHPESLDFCADGIYRRARCLIFLTGYYRGL